MFVQKKVDLLEFPSFPSFVYEFIWSQCLITECWYVVLGCFSMQWLLSPLRPLRQTTAWKHGYSVWLLFSPIFCSSQNHNSFRKLRSQKLYPFSAFTRKKSEFMHRMCLSLSEKCGLLVCPISVASVFALLILLRNPCPFCTTHGITFFSMRL